MKLTKLGANPDPMPVKSLRHVGKASVLALDEQGRTRACWEDGDGNLYPGPVVKRTDEDNAKYAARATERDAKVAAARDEMLALREIKQRRQDNEPLRPQDIEVLADVLLKQVKI